MGGFQRSQTRAFSDLNFPYKNNFDHWKLSVTSDKKVCFSQRHLEFILLRNEMSRR